MEIKRISMAMEIDGDACIVVLPQERMQMLVNLAASLSDSGKLPVKKLNHKYKIENIDDTEETR